jgi:hypothetical protein
MKYISKRWQDSWDQQIHNKLQERIDLPVQPYHHP